MSTTKIARLRCPPDGRPTIHEKPTLWYRFGPLVPAALLCLVAGLQVFLSRTGGLSPWNGGGFGMFSTNDDGLARSLTVRVSGPEGQRDVSVTRSLSSAVTLAVSIPSRKHLSALGLEIAELEKAQGFPVSRVHIAVRRLGYDHRTLAPRLEVVRELELEMQPDWRDQ